MKLWVIIFFFLLVVSHNSQTDCEVYKKSSEKRYFLKLSHVSSKTNGIRTFCSRGIEFIYRPNIAAKGRYKAVIGLGYYYRNLICRNNYGGNYDGIDVASMRVINFNLIHQTIEVPALLKYSITGNKTNSRSFWIYTGGSFVYLVKGKLNFTKPESQDIISNLYVPEEYYSYTYSFQRIRAENHFNENIHVNRFFPPYNFKITNGMEYFFLKNFSVGMEYNYFLRRIGEQFRTEPNIIPSRRPNYKNFSIFITLKF